MSINDKQRCIDVFIESSEKLREKYYPHSRLYVNNQRAVMQYLFLKYPESNYGYKASQAKRFADCVEFYEDWGPMKDFRMGTFYKMCDWLVEEIKKCDALLEIHRSRYKNSNRQFHPDINLHILAQDIIYSSQAYDFYKGISFSPIKAKEREEYLGTATLVRMKGISSEEREWISSSS